ncbi:hypothetical protein [Anaerovorax sp. IOR16]|uniref:hypothetical protein n=1 Tax=Anaerovorax sp. IOR16 TaxID=2773458 RepID=UPI0019D241EE|nr:hypothetical protein [Anaerovorax sp. IOR16]
MEKYCVEFLESVKTCDNYETAKLEKDKIIDDINNGVYDNEETPFDFLNSFLNPDMEITKEEIRSNAISSITVTKKMYTASGILKRIINLDKDGKELNYERLIIIDDIPINLKNKDDVVYIDGGMICHVCPFFDIPLQLSICICPNGDILHRGWDWINISNWNSYLHTISKKNEVLVTEEMKNTVGGLFSGRIKFEGFKLAVGGTVQEICPIDIAEEEKKS